MSIKELLDKIGLQQEGNQEEDKYIIEIADSNEYSKVFTILDNAEILEIDEGATLLTDKLGELYFYGEGYEIKLIGNFASDIYRVVITEEGE